MSVVDRLQYRTLHPRGRGGRFRRKEMLKAVGETGKMFYPAMQDPGHKLEFGEEFVLVNKARRRALKQLERQGLVKTVAEYPGGSTVPQHMFHITDRGRAKLRAHGREDRLLKKLG